MTNPVAQVHHVIDGDVEYDALAFVCPGCKSVEYGSGLHLLPVNATNHTPSWAWDGNLEAPTLSPSILTDGSPVFKCHSYLRAGVFEFLSDCTHELAGQHVPLPPLEDWMLN